MKRELEEEEEEDPKSVVFAFSDAQCERVFSSLPLYKKQCILYGGGLNSFQLKVGSFSDPSFLRDILKLLALYVSIETWGRMKQVCKTFNAALKVPGSIARIQKVPANVWHPERKHVFWAWLARYMYLTGRGFRHGYTIGWVRHAVLNIKDRRRYVPLDDGSDVRYPDGFIRLNGIVRCTIFDQNVVELFTYNSALDNSQRHPRTVVQYSAEMRVLYKETQKRWKAMRKREK